MTRCGLAEGVTLEFPNQGIIVRPQDADIRAERRNFVMAKFELPEAAAKLVSQDVPEGDYGYIRFDGNRARRVHRPEDAVVFKEDLDRITYGELTLEDPRYVMRHGNVTKYWDTATLGTMVDYIMDQVHDPYGVITDYRFMTPELREQQRIAPFDWPSPFGVLDIVNQVVDGIAGFVNGIANWAGADTSTSRTSTIDLENATPLEAFQTVMDDFELDWWVDEEGVLWIGPNVANGQVLATVAGDNNIALKDYSITRVANTTNSVQVQGPLQQSMLQKGPTYALDDGVQVIAEASAPGAPGSAMSLETNKNIPEPEDLESAAALMLIQEMMDDVEGSLKINGMASQNTEALAELDIGDVLYVDDSIDSECNENVTTGLFMVNSVQHRVNRRTGWEITTRLSRFPNPETINTRSVIYDPTTDTSYDSLEAYQAGESIEDQQSDDDEFLGRDIEDFFIILGAGG